MPKKRVVNAVLGAALCASLVPVKAVEAFAEESADPLSTIAESEADLREEEGAGGPEAEVGSGSSAEENEERKAEAEANANDVSTEGESPVDGVSTNAVETNSVDVEPAEEKAADASATGSVHIVRNGAPVEYGSVVEAVADALDGETVVVSGTHALSKPISISDGRSISIRSEGDATVVRGEGYPQTNGKPSALVKLSGKSTLSIEAGSADAVLELDGQKKDSDEAIVIVDGGSSFTMGEGAVVKNAQASWKPWGGVYVKNGSFVLDGGKIVDGFAMKNAAVAVEASGSFEMRSGEISGNHTSYSEASIWVKGRFSMSGGSITGNRANSGASADGVVYVLDGGRFEFTGGEIGRSSVSNSCAVYLQNATLSIADSACIVGSDRIILKGSTFVDVKRGLTGHTSDEPLPLVLADSWDAGRVVAKFASPEEARKGMSYISAVTGGQAAQPVALSVDPANSSWISVASGDDAALFELLENPYADNLGFEFKDELLGDGALDAVRARLDAFYDGIESPDKEQRYERLAYIERQMAYLDANRDAVEGSVETLSSIGNPVTDRDRTKQNFMFDNLDATGYYLKPGQANEFYLYVDADSPSDLSLAWRQVGLTESNSYTSLNLSQLTQLENGVNRIVVDLTGKQYGYMLYMRNDSTSNAAKVRFEGADANEAGSPAIVGTQLGEHPHYIYDSSRPELFWDFVQEIRAYVDEVGRGEEQDMAFLQMGDDGRAQFSIRAGALASAYSSIGSQEDAVAYIQKSNDAIQERLDFFWRFDGFDSSLSDGPNAASRMRVHTAFTKTVSYPSTMYATGRYFHMPESSAASFLSGTSMYGWGMSHEYGHVLDNSVLVVNEETNNMYSIAGARYGEMLASASAGRAFDPVKAYHTNAIRAMNLWDAELEKMAADPSYAPDWNTGGWGYYIWAHLTAWWNGTHFFDGWDYSDYDFAASPFSEEAAAEVKEWGAFGATMRILRSDADAVSTIEKATASIQDGTSRKYNRIAMAYTMGTGYNFAEYLEIMGQRDLSDEVKRFCAQYPSMPRKVQYYSYKADAAELNGATAYEGSVKPLVTIEHAGDTVHVEAEMASSALTKSTIAYELYRGEELVGFSRNGSFEYALDGDFDQDEYSVVAYDVRLNPSEAGYASEIPFSVDFPSMTVGESVDGKVAVSGPEGATYSFEVEDDSVLEIAADGSIVAKSAGTTSVHVTMHRPGKPDQGPFKFSATVSPRTLVLQVSDASAYLGASMGQPGIQIVEGSLLDGDSLGEASYYVIDGEGASVVPDAPGTYAITAQVTGLGSNYDVRVEPGSLTVLQESASADWVRLEDAQGSPLSDGQWSRGPVRIAAAEAQGAAGVYDRIALAGKGDGADGSDGLADAAAAADADGRSVGEGAPSAYVEVSEEGEVAYDVVMGVSSGQNAGAVSSPLSVTVRIDMTAPSVAVSKADASARSGSGAIVAIEASDNAPEGVNATSGVASVSYKVLDSKGTLVSEGLTSGSSATVELAEAGEYEVVATATDFAGNTSEAQSLKVEVADSSPDGSGDGGGSGDSDGSGNGGGTGGSDGSGEGPGNPGDGSDGLAGGGGGNGSDGSDGGSGPGSGAGASDDQGVGSPNGGASDANPGSQDGASNQTGKDSGATLAATSDSAPLIALVAGASAVIAAAVAMACIVITGARAKGAASSRSGRRA